jgi:tetratricopeptide (TPR) repeat protein
MSSRAVTLPELGAISAVVDKALEQALTELDRLFLVFRSGGEQQMFSIGANTRTLVERVASTKYPDLWAAVRRAYESIAGNVPRAGAPGAIRRAYFFVRSGEFSIAEALLRRELEQGTNTGQVLAYLGWVYKAWQPPRLTDARECFAKAWQLKWKTTDMYRHWSDMECRQREWTRGAEAAERGLRLAPDNPVLLQQAGYARSRLGRELRSQLLSARSADEFKRAQAHLKAALKYSSKLGIDTDEVLPLIFKALVLNSECVGERKTLERTLEQWIERFPKDPELLRLARS